LREGTEQRAKPTSLRDYPLEHRWQVNRQPLCARILAKSQKLLMIRMQAPWSRDRQQNPSAALHGSGRLEPAQCKTPPRLMAARGVA